MGRATCSGPSFLATSALLMILSWPAPADLLPRHTRDSADSPAAGFAWQLMRLENRVPGSSAQEPRLKIRARVYGAGTGVLGCAQSRPGVGALSRALRGGGDEEGSDGLTPEEKAWMAALEDAPMQDLLEAARAARDGVAAFDEQADALSEQDRKADGKLALLRSQVGALVNRTAHDSARILGPQQVMRNREDQQVVRNREDGEVMSDGEEHDVVMRDGGDDDGPALGTGVPGEKDLRRMTEELREMRRAVAEANQDPYQVDAPKVVRFEALASQGGGAWLAMEGESKWSDAPGDWFVTLLHSDYDVAIQVQHNDSGSFFFTCPSLPYVQICHEWAEVQDLGCDGSFLNPSDVDALRAYRSDPSSSATRTVPPGGEMQAGYWTFSVKQGMLVAENDLEASELVPPVRLLLEPDGFVLTAADGAAVVLLGPSGVPRRVEEYDRARVKQARRLGLREPRAGWASIAPPKRVPPSVLSAEEEAEQLRQKDRPVIEVVGDYMPDPDEQRDEEEGSGDEKPFWTDVDKHLPDLEKFSSTSEPSDPLEWANANESNADIFEMCENEAGDEIWIHPRNWTVGAYRSIRIAPMEDAVKDAAGFE